MCCPTPSLANGSRIGFIESEMKHPRFLLDPFAVAGRGKGLGTRTGPDLVESVYRAERAEADIVRTVGGIERRDVPFEGVGAVGARFARLYHRSHARVNGEETICSFFFFFFRCFSRPPRDDATVTRDICTLKFRRVREMELCRDDFKSFGRAGRRRAPPSPPLGKNLRVLRTYMAFTRDATRRSVLRRARARAATFPRSSSRDFSTART